MRVLCAADRPGRGERPPSGRLPLRPSGACAQVSDAREEPNGGRVVERASAALRNQVGG
jgi:hypothetical protein